MTFRETSSRIKIIILISSLIGLGGCNPELYRQPAQDFKTASHSLESAYFTELDISNKARIQRGDLEDQIAIWGASPGVVNKSYTERVSLTMIKRREEDVHKDITILRRVAFDTLEGYASTLVSLSSEKETEAIVNELNALGGDITNALEMVGSITSTSEQLSRYAGPLKQYVEILNEVVRIVSNVMRERAIMETIGASNDPILELLAILKNEAVAASENSKRQFAASRLELESFLSRDDFMLTTNVSKATIAEKIADLKILEERMGKDDIDKAFDAAVKAQGALVRKAVLRDPQDWALQIRAFRERVVNTRETIERIRSDM